MDLFFNLYQIIQLYKIILRNHTSHINKGQYYSLSCNNIYLFNYFIIWFIVNYVCKPTTIWAETKICLQSGLSL